MIPTINLGQLHIASYSLMVLLGAICFTVISIAIFEKLEKVDQKITNRILIISIFGFAALVGFAFIANSIFHSIEEGKIVLGGITWLGGVLGAFPVMIFLIHKFCPMVKGEALECFNLLIPGIVVAHGFGRVGCFLGGCCYGAVTDSIFGVSFPDGSMAANQYPSATGGSLPVFPTQLFEAVFDCLLFIVMMILYKKAKKHFLEIYAFSYGTFRFLLEFIRGDDRGATGINLSPSQIMSIMLIVGGIVVLLYNKKIIFKKVHKKMDDYIEKRKNPDAESYSNSIIKLIKELKTLADNQIITQEEYEIKKKELLSRL